MNRAHLRNIAIIFVGLGIPTTLLAAAFQGPSQNPPSGNAPGVIWNTKVSALQQDAAFNVTGNGSVGGTLTTGSDVSVKNSKSFRVDSPSGMSTYQMGNWGYGVGPQSFTFYLNGDLEVSDSGPGINPGERGRITAQEYCFFSGACIQAWPSGAGNYVSRGGDAMTGPLSISESYSGAVGATSTLYVAANPSFGTTYTSMKAIDAISSPPNSANPTGALRVIAGTVNNSAPGSTLSESSAVFGNNANTGGTVDYSYGGDFIASVNNNGKVNQEVAGVHGQFNATTDFSSIARAYGLFGEALNSAPTKSVSTLYGVQGYAQGKSTVETVGVMGDVFVNKTLTTPQQGVVGETELFTGGSANDAYGVRGFVKNTGGSATNAYGTYGSVAGVTATNRYGVYGDGGSTVGTGVYGKGGAFGVYGDGSPGGSGIGGYFSGPLWGVYGVAGVGIGAGVRGAAGSGSAGVFGSAPPGKIAVLAESETSSQGTPLVSRYGSVGADISGQSYGIKVRSAGAVGIDIDAVTGIRASSTNQATWFDNNSNGVYSRATNAGIFGVTKGNSVTSVGVYGANEIAGGVAARFNNVAGSTDVYIGSGSNAIDIKNASGQMFFINSSGEVHANGSPYAGYYFHDRADLVNKWYAWYADGGAASTARLYRNTVGDIMTVDSVGNLTIGTGTTGCLKDRDGTILAGTCSSDISLKENIQTWDKDALSVISKLPVKTYDWKADGKDQLGLIAQDALKADKDLVEVGKDGLLQVHFEKLPYYNIRAIQQLKSENDALKAKLDTLEQRLQKLEEKVK